MNADNGIMSAQEARAVLGVEASVDEVALRCAFREAVKASHPDRPGGDAARLRAVIAAYRRLESGEQDRPARKPSKPPAPRRDPRAATMAISPATAAVGGLSRVTLAGCETMVKLPAGLRQGDRTRVCGQVYVVDVRGDQHASVIGDHLCLTVPVSAALLRAGGRLAVDTPQGPLQVWVSGGDAARGLVQVRDRGLPARGERPAGDLFVRLKPAAVEAEVETPVRSKRRRFAAAWAA